MSGRFGFGSFVSETVVGKHKANGLVGIADSQNVELTI